MERKRIEVVAACIVRDGKVLATQRGYGEWKDWWEFPGGKIESDETPAEALVREIREELDAEISVDRLIRTIDYDYPGFHLTMHCFRCTPVSSDFRLLEHLSARWLDAAHMDSVRWLPADLELIQAKNDIFAEKIQDYDKC